MEQDSIPPARRRILLMTILGGVGTVLAAASGWPVWRFLSPRSAEGDAEKVKIARSQVELGQAHFFSFRGQPAVVLQASAGSFSVFSAVCTHLGCIVKWLPEDGEFLCPCHAGRFSAEGAVLGGPPPKSLESIPVAIEGDQLLIG